MSENKITTIIFDMDGVLINSEPTHQKMGREQFEALGLNISDEEFMSYVGTSSINMWTRIINKHGLNEDPYDLLLKGRGKYIKVLKEGKVPMVEGAMDLVKRLHKKGYKLVVASSASRKTVEAVLDYFDLQKYFIAKIAGDEVEHSKPNPEIFLKIAKAVGSSPDECLVIEDSSNGVKAAKDAGMACVAYKNHGTGIQDLSQADMIVTDLSEID